MERKQVEVIGGLKLADEGRGSCVFASLNVIDKDGDITRPGAFGNQRAHFLPMHQWSDAEPVFLGVADIEGRGDKAIANFKLNLELDRAKNWRSALKFALDNGLNIEFSYGFMVLDSEQGEVDGRRVRILKKLKVHEVSPVVIGAGMDTGLLAMKGSESESEKARLDQAVRDHQNMIVKAAALNCRLRQMELDNKHVYMRVSASHINEAKRNLAGLAAEFASVELGLKFVPGIGWFSPATKEDFEVGVDHLEHFQSDSDSLQGMYSKSANPQMIYVRSDLDEISTVATVVHECAHAAGWHDEETAREFEREATKRFFVLAGPVYQEQTWNGIPGFDPSAR